MNNREIKFRIWDKKNNMFIYVWDASHKRLAISLNGLVYSGMYDDILPENDYNIQQYTGLKDKNGAEIYEGDIVQIVEKDETRIYDIVFSHGYFGLNRGPKSKHALMYPYTDVFEIIGNIMQTPELIKDHHE